jgi:hypothetical protein
MQLPTGFYPPTLKLLPVTTLKITKIAADGKETTLETTDPYTTPYSLTLELAATKTFEINS